MLGLKKDLVLNYAIERKKHAIKHFFSKKKWNESFLSYNIYTVIQELGVSLNVQFKRPFQFANAFPGIIPIISQLIPCVKCLEVKSFMSSYF